MTIIDRSEERWDERYQTHMAAMTGSIDLIRSSMLDLDKLNSARKLEIAQLRAGLWGVYSDHTETMVYDQKSADQEAVLAAAPDPQVPQEETST